MSKKELVKSDVDSAGGARSSQKTRGVEPAGEFMEVGQEVVPGMRLRCICRGHTGTIGRIAWSPCGRFIASHSEDKTIRIWDASRALSVPNETFSMLVCTQKRG